MSRSCNASAAWQPVQHQCLSGHCTVVMGLMPATRNHSDSAVGTEALCVLCAALPGDRYWVSKGERKGANPLSVSSHMPAAVAGMQQHVLNSSRRSNSSRGPWLQQRM